MPSPPATLSPSVSPPLLFVSALVALPLASVAFSVVVVVADAVDNVEELPSEVAVVPAKPSVSVTVRVAVHLKDLFRLRFPL